MGLRLCAVALAVTLLAPATAAAADPRASLPDIEDEVMCLVCGVPLELATESPQAIQERDFIRRLIAQGRTKDQIKDELVSEYGEDVLAVPGDSGFDLAAWLVPGLGILVAAVAAGFGVARWRRALPAGEDADDARSAERPATEDEQRLKEDIARYEL